ncbi:MAG: hypothetical protein IJV40_14225 [Oscillospiraceae bacterium]|nr:hypothetical protein [Oscillospiraceae bacterium]
MKNAGRIAAKKQKRYLLPLSAAAFCLLLIRPLPASWLLAPAVTVLLLSALISTGTVSKPAGNEIEKPIRPAAVVLALLLAGIFLAVWLRTKRLVSLRFFAWREALPILLAAVVGTVGAVPFLSALLNQKENTLKESRWESSHRENTQLNREDRRLLFCAALVTVSICSLSSPLYPFNDWVDANCFFTVGKSMLFGVVPYRDLYEQKGPLLYAVYSLCYLVSHRSFLGAWLLEIAAAWAFLSLAYKSHLLLTGKRDPIFLFLTAAIVYTVPAFLKGGSAEELSLPLVMLAFYYGLRAVSSGRDLSNREAFLIGLSSGAVLWIKYSMLGFYVGFILVPMVLMIREGRAARLMKLLGLIILGVAAASLPVFLYFGYHHALPSLWEAYFYNNIFVYGKASSVLNTVKGLASGGASMLTYNDATVLLFLFTVCSLWQRRKRRLSIHVLLSFVFAFGLIYAGGINLKYYSEILCVFVPIGVTELLRFCGEVRKSRTESGANKEQKTDPKSVRIQRFARVLIPLSFTVCLFGSENSHMLTYRRDEMPQFVFAETLRETPDATLFNYGALDVGLFTTADIVPSTRYFCMLNLPSEEMVREMEHYMADGVTDYIVSRGLEVDSPRYLLLQTVYFPDNGELYPYYLYVKESP